jgi:hypothetical protein
MSGKRIDHFDKYFQYTGSSYIHRSREEIEAEIRQIILKFQLDRLDREQRLADERQEREQKIREINTIVAVHGDSYDSDYVQTP